jgi:thiol:disulfide interchange protein
MKYLALFVLISLTACKSQKDVVVEDDPIQYDLSNNFKFIKDASLIDVIDQAIEEDKLVFLDIYTDWCLPCQVMDDEVFSDDDLGDYISSNFINFKVNAEKGYGPNIATLYGVQGFPSLIFLDQNGRILEQKNGMAFHTELREMADNAIITNNRNQASE